MATLILRLDIDPLTRKKNVWVPARTSGNAAAIRMASISPKRAGLSTACAAEPGILLAGRSAATSTTGVPVPRVEFIFPNRSRTAAR